MKRKTTNTDGPGKVEGDCIVPPAIPKPELHKLMFRYSEIEAQAITDYMASQARDETVLHLEKVASERIFDRQHDVWDVHTDKERWWVVTQPTNLHSQTLMPSLDYTLSFHIGLMARMADTVMLSDLFINNLKVAKINVHVDGGTQQEWVATALAIAHEVGNLGANSIEATVDRSDLGGIEPAPSPMFFHLARVSFSPDPKHTVWDNMPQASISVTEMPAPREREEVQRGDEFEALVEKNNDNGMESDVAETKAAATIAKKYYLSRDWQFYSGGLDETKFPKADYNVDSSSAANSLASLDACMRGKIIRMLQPCE